MSACASVNGESVELIPGTTVADIVGTLTGGGRGVAVARNGEVVPRSEWGTTVVKAEDRIEVLTAAQGG
ncbi:MAG TPA: sulfur carrier protein ThiS [Acidimicrobiales bacterium]|nr:sulfur carrier protein ThiS [Acidimicrobiales bacterium]